MQIRQVFLNWLPWLLMMKRPGRMFTRNSFHRARDVTDLTGLNDKTSKSLLANVLDMDDNSLHRFEGMENNFVKATHITDENFRQQVKIIDKSPKQRSGARSELLLILKELRYVADRMRKEDDEIETCNDWK